jgi:tetratricopeptide (TPR) repeat protein
MAMEPVIFISAVSKELRSARQLVANTLKLLGYDHDWQDIFGTEEGDLRGMLRRRIDASAGVVQLVGQCYGAEPKTPDEQFGRVSYTQYEALYAKQRGKKVWYLILDQNFTTDPFEAEPKELLALQDAYRQRVAGEGSLYYRLGNPDALRATVLELRRDLEVLRRRWKQWAIGVVALLVGIAALVIWQTKKVTALGQSGDDMKRTVAEMRDELKKQSEILKTYADALAQAKGPPAGLNKETKAEDQAYVDMAQRTGEDAEAVREQVRQSTDNVEDSPLATSYERAIAAYIKNDYQKAESFALRAADENQTAGPADNEAIIKALELAGWSAEKQKNYADQVNHFSAAAKLTDRDGEPLRWAQVQYELASALISYGRYAEAENILRTVARIYTDQLGRESPYTIGTRLSLAIALDHQDKNKEAITEDRALIEIEQSVSDPGRTDTVLTLHNNLGLALYADRQFAEAEKEERYVFENTRDTRGLSDRLTLFSLNNLAMALDAQGKHEEAEKDFKQALELKDQNPDLGPKDQLTLYTVYYLAICLQCQGKIPGAIQFAERAAKGMADLVGRGQLPPDHPDVIKYRKFYDQLSAKRSPLPDYCP